ncbi:terpene cyclase/mutase family protein [Bacillus benzoevorans]|uniref:Sporulenol synthase n=1 Tax=Bacillus benzoevorans TaxID=1456 RepID=A0A7X0HQU9_9BACI|nr:prenyltransferase/squalene oxidase repeat-containing protein [Bacillus benzoevorans]MBB6445267.1 sporulenol synthase [Bacillus benzoevorans]
MRNTTSIGIQRIIDKLKHDQSPDGSWKYPFETGIATDCYMIILLRTLGIHEENLIRGLCERILSKQEKSGGWKLFFDDEKENVSATLEAYYALLYSGYYKRNDSRLMAAKKKFLANGGIQECHMLTKVMLSVTGQLKWPAFFPFPLEMILLPASFPVNLYSFSVFGRANLIPLLILAQQKKQFKTEDSPNISALLVRDQFDFWNHEEWHELFSAIEKGIKSLIGLPGLLHQQALEKARQYMLARIEPDGTFLNYFSSTFLMIFALLSLGFRKTDKLILQAVEGLKGMMCEINGLPHMQYTTATIWNTALISTALQNSGVAYSVPMIMKSNEYLLRRQQKKYGDWVVYNPGGRPGSWGFADMNTIHPDVDDTTAALRSLTRTASAEPFHYRSWKKGLNWILTMQNDDGGWPAFEKRISNKVFNLLPIEGAEYLLGDPSTPDLTGRTLEYLSLYTNLGHHHRAIREGVRWLLKQQKQNGSWYGRWGICYIYGTWAALTGLAAADIKSSSPAIAKAVKWLKEIQHHDGGWGESCKSDKQRMYVSLGASTLTHTAWALDALIAVSNRPTETISKGIAFLLGNLEVDDWTTAYPAGQGMAGAFYMHYHSYRYIFPLLALSHYHNKYF